MAESNVRAAIYTRISLAILKDTTKTDEQERLCRELCARRGWEVVKVYTDLSKSAWKRKRNPDGSLGQPRRPGWDAMLADVKAGEFRAIVTYWGDRIVRQPRDLEDLLDLREGRSISLASIAGQYDFDNKDHRMMMRWEVARACNESDTISDRKKGQYERWRREGRVRTGGRGGRPFGFKPDGITHVPEEVAVLRDAARRILRGESVSSVAQSITLLTPAGRQFKTVTLRKMLARPRMAGLMPDEVSNAAWAPVLERDEWEMICAILDSRSAACPRPTNARKWLLSGIAVCSECWTPLAIRQGSSRKGHPAQLSYDCMRPGCKKVSRAAALLDAFVSGAVVARLNNPANPQPEYQLHDGLAAELAALTRRRSETEEAIAGLADTPGQRIDVLARALEGFDRKINDVREQMAAGVGERLLSAHANITREGWEALPLDVRRSLVRATFRVIVKPASKRGPGFRPEDVTLPPVTAFLQGTPRRNLKRW